MVQTAALKMHAMPALRAKENKTDRKEWEKWLIMRQSNSSNIVQSRIWWVKGLSFTDELALKCMLRKEERKKLKEEWYNTYWLNLTCHLSILYMLLHCRELMPSWSDRGRFMIYDSLGIDLQLAAVAASWHDYLSRRAKNICIYILHDFAF